MIKDAFTGIFGSKTARRYFPAIPGVQLRSDAKTAELENGGMQDGHTYDVMDNENAVTHLGIHMPLLMGAAQSLAQASGGQGQAPDMAAIGKVYGLLAVGLPHCSAHLQTIASDPTQKQIVQVVVNALRKLDSTATHLQFQLKTAATAAQRSAVLNSQQQTESAAKMQLDAAKLALAGRKQAHKESVDGIKLAIDLKKATNDLDVSKIQTAIQLQQAITTNSQNIAQAQQSNAPQTQAPAQTSQ